MAAVPERHPEPVPARGDFAAAAVWIRAVREAQLQRRPGEGLREHKKRLTRQQISDTATWMFCERGFDAVRVADVAEAVGVSEKTVFNYFPTKESLVFDREQELTAEIVGALRARDLSTSPVEAVLDLLERDTRAPIPPGATWMAQAFDELISQTPALVAAQRAMTRRIIAAIAETLAETAELDPRDPEPQVVGHALMGLWEVHETSTSRHIEGGLSGAELNAAVAADTRRAARLLETGLWTYNLFTQGKRTAREIADATRAAQDARRQIAAALREARAAWRAARRR